MKTMEEIEDDVSKMFEDKIESIKNRLQHEPLTFEDIPTGIRRPKAYTEFDTTCICGCNTNCSPICKNRIDAEDVFNNIIKDMCDKTGYKGEIPIFKLEEYNGES